MTIDEFIVELRKLPPDTKIIYLPPPKSATSGVTIEMKVFA